MNIADVAAIICFVFAAYLLKILIDSNKFKNKVLDISKKELETTEKLILTLEKLIEKIENWYSYNLTAVYF